MEDDKETLLENIEQLKARFANTGSPTELNEINGWEAEAKRLLLNESLKDHKAMQYILENLRKDIRHMDHLLLTSRSTDLSDQERDRVLDRKALYVYFVDMFDGNEKSIQELNRRAKANLEANPE